MISVSIFCCLFLIQILFTQPYSSAFSGGQFRDVQHVHRVVQPPPLCHCRVILSPSKVAQSPLAATPPAPSPSTWQPLLCFLSLWICLFWTFPINGITQHVAVRVWLLSLSMMFSGFVHVITCVRAPFLMARCYSIV